MRGGWVERGTVMIRLGRVHFAFFRGYLDGLEVAGLAARYLATQLPAARGGARPDLRLAKSSVKWIRSQLLVLARRSLAPADVRLLALAPALLLVEYGREAPALDEFRQEHDADGMYSEAELITVYEQTYGDQSAAAERRATRNRRLRQRQQQALNQLEAITAHDPQPADRIDGWLDPALASRLHAVGVDYLAELVALIDRHGYRWYCKVPRIGIKAALQIAHWLQDESVRAIPGLQPAGRPYQPARTLPAAVPYPRRTAIVALEHFCMPSQQPIRQEGVSPVETGIRAIAMTPATKGLQQDDVAAIERWLSHKPLRRHTWRAYRKEAERLLLWTVQERGKTLSTLRSEDCAAYRLFLSLIGTASDADWHAYFQLPQTAWVGTPGAARDSRFWRPFQGTLGIPSQRQAMTILKGMLAWLTEQAYLANNPMQDAHLPSRCRSVNRPVRALNQVEWQALDTHLHAQLTDWRHDRLICVLALVTGAGLRLAELAALRRGHLHAAVPGREHRSGWTLRLSAVQGALDGDAKIKCSNEKVVTLDGRVMVALERYFQRRGFVDFASAPVDTPIIAALPNKLPATSANIDIGTAPEAALTVDRIHRIIKRMFNDVAAHHIADDPTLAARLLSASADWVRCTTNRFPLD